MILQLIRLDRDSKKPLYRQLVDQFIEAIRNGLLMAGSQIPGTRQISQKLLLHRKTVVAAMDELVAQGWLETVVGKGTYVAAKIDSLQYHTLPELSVHVNSLPQLIRPAVLDRTLHITTQKYHLDDGLPDPRLAPVEEMMRAYKSAMTNGFRYPKYTYGDTRGHVLLRENLCEYLLKTRGMKVNKDQILITRGVTQALYLSIKAFIQKGDKVAVGELNWESANVNFIYHGADLIRIRVDDQGLDVDHLEQICLQQSIKMVFVTPHHQYPTTVIMPAYRRVKLIQLARIHGFYVFEDDYDYDFHYSRHPVMPLASADHQGFILYTGSFSKAIAPVFRVGYLVATEEQVDYLSRLRRLVDRQGDTILELAIAELLQLGIIQRYLKKNRKIYQTRRDFFADLLRDQLNTWLDFRVPDGGMSIWTKFNSGIDLRSLSKKALSRDLFFQDGSSFATTDINFNATRLGFASSSEQELEVAVKILRELLEGR